MKVTILGSGTSTGVPVVGCRCNVCLSRDPKNYRTRTSILVSVAGKNLVIDTPPDFHQQALANHLEEIDAVLFTHEHADHIFGLDELRMFNFIKGGPIPIYGSLRVINRIRLLYDYIWDPEAPIGGGKPMLETFGVDGEFEVFGVGVKPIEIYHGPQMIYGYRINDFAYLTDCSGIPEKSREKLAGLKVLIMGALRFRPHPTHFSLEQALDEIKLLKPRRAILTHLGHSFDYQEMNSILPEGVELAYDGMMIEV